MNKLALLVPLAIGTLGAVAPLSGCSSDKNHDQRNSPDAAAPKPDYHSMTIDQLLLACIGVEEGKPWINDMPPKCMEDPGSRPVNQAKAQQGLTFAWVWNLDMDRHARATYTYDDNTALFVVPERDSRSNGYNRDPLKVDIAYAGWQPLAYPIPAVPGLTLTNAVRLRGGPFTEYGGGFGQSFRTATNGDGTMINELGAPVTPPFSPEFSSASNGAYDLRTYTGIAIWARRGPQGMSTLRVGITERNSAEDLNSGALASYFPDDHPGIEENKHCRRWRLCGCSAGTPCSPVDPTAAFPSYKCFDPARGDDPNQAISCGSTRCTEVNTSTTMPDPLFTSAGPDGASVGTCTLYQTSDGRSDSFCYDPKKDPPPPAKRERCNNPYSRPITVTTDWQLIKVPFTELLQADEGHVADDFDLASVKQIVVTHGGGWTDFWIANLGFYKKL